ncbi:peptide deformylase [Chloroherpeton thalassium ATCC 35110]|uniref:Peptide deformylase n=2 Tax=Chloroherpeton thalassium TaxID=100716 RepID=B3QS23_CHLT3|nr:peptide deformylase [Chloroherpeton thalassium ATCC 35110]
MVFGKIKDTKINISFLINMSILPVYTLGEPVLNKVAKPLKGVDAEMKQFIEDMFETMYNADGIGLAAPQVGKSLRLLVVDVSVMEDYQDEKPLVVINPQILETKGLSTMEEGCLSVPGVHEEVTRPKQITLKYRDADFVERVEIYDGMMARVLQHEIEHLQGNLFIDNLDAKTRRLHREELDAIKNGEVETAYLVAKKLKTV